MYVRTLQEKEILDALHLVWEVFAEANAPYMSTQGVASFQQFIKLDQFLPKVRNGEMTVFGALENYELAGVCAVRKDGHVALLFVKNGFRKRGVARMLIQAASDHCVSRLHVTRMTVNAALQAAEAYRRLGFAETAEQQEQDGVPYLPMERYLVHGGGRNTKKRNSHTGLIIGVSITVALLTALLVFLIGKITFSFAEVMESRPQQERKYEGSFSFGNGGAFGDNGDSGKDGFVDEPQEEPGEEASKEGIESIQCFEAEKLSYTIREETYTYSSNGQKGEYPMEFDVSYPQIEGLDSEKADEINKMLKECAMSTVDTIYLQPSEAMKEAMLREQSPFMASQVKYRVTYADEDFISVVFTDHYFVGNYYAEFQDLRTRNIRLSDGARIETADIVDLTDEFMEDWMGRMKKEAPEAEVLDGLTTSQFRRILNGEILENRYYDNFFVDAEGIQIGLTYHYANEEQTTIARGWITAPFKRSEIVKYKKDHDFWNLIK